MIIKDIDQEVEGTIKEFGDFQTPSSLANRTCQILAAKGIEPTQIVEPTCGEGTFIIEAVKVFSTVKSIYGLEIQKHYIEKCFGEISKYIKDNIDVKLYHSNFFEHDFSDLDISKETVIIGNPPWVTSAELSEKTGWNLPVKTNFKSLSGFDAITGKSNFDITEAIIINLLDKMNDSKSGILAMLCKKTVIKNIIEYQKKKNWCIAEFEAYEFDAKKEFNVSTEAALLFVRFEETEEKAYQCDYFSIYEPTVKKLSMGWIGDRFVSNIESYLESPDVDGECEFVWRSGIKHDCAKVMELRYKEGILVNGFNEEMDIEQDLVYSVMKSSDVANQRLDKIGLKKVIVTQKVIGEDTNYISKEYPKLWNYLLKHADKLDGRKSSIYIKNPRFSIFGVGDYSFLEYKVAIAGMYKECRFSLICPDSENKPVMFDDTCYFLSFNNLKEASITITILNHEIVRAFLQNICFKDSKRPYTKQVLMRVNFFKAINLIGAKQIIDSVHENYHVYINEEDIETYLENFIYPNNNMELFPI